MRFKKLNGTFNIFSTAFYRTFLFKLIDKLLIKILNTTFLNADDIHIYFKMRENVSD